MKVDECVRRETGYISLCVLILSALMEAVFLIAGFWDITVLYGNLLGAAAAIANFFLMGLTVQKAVDKDAKDASNSMKASQGLRMVFLFAVAALGVSLSCFHPLAVLLPLLFPRLAIAVRPVFNKKGTKA